MLDLFTRIRLKEIGVKDTHISAIVAPTIGENPSPLALTPLADGEAISNASKQALISFIFQ